jgi:dihydrofolate synthase/folylpolyglutamate synthase
LNAARAITVLLSLKGKYPEFSFLTPEAIKSGLNRTDWPGRMEIFNRGGKLVMLDGAHNGHAMETIVSSLSRPEGLKTKIGAAVFAIMNDKDIPPVVENLKKLNCPVYCTELYMERSARASELAEMSRASGLNVASSHSDPEEALGAALDKIRQNEIVLCCGSLFLVGFFRKMLKYREILGRLPISDATNDEASVRI